jgi:heptosyltransferase-2
MDAFSPKKIIVRMPNWIGDLVMATPILADLRQKWPHAHITAMCMNSLSPLLQNNPYINEIFTFNKVKGFRTRAYKKELIQKIRVEQYELGVLLTNSFSSAWWFWKGNVKRRIGYKGNWRNLLLTYSVDRPKNEEKQHLVLTYKQVLAPLNISVTSTRPELFLSSQESAQVEALLAGEGINIKQDIIVGINPGAAYGSAKCWLPDRFEELIARLSANPRVAILIFGDPSLFPLGEQIKLAAGSKKVINLAGKTTLRELLHFIQSCNLFITNDSGPMHIAAALNVRLIALFGSTNEVATGPYNKEAVVIHKHVSCSPCYRRTCPIDFRCMKQIYVDEVYQTAHRILFPS